MTTTQTPGPDSLSEHQIREKVDLIRLNNGFSVSIASLKQMLPDTETALFFGKAYDLDYATMSKILREVFHTDVVQALLGEGHTHSNELQDYIVETVPDHVMDHSSVGYDEDTDPPDTELLKQAWEAALVEVAQSVKDVANKLGATLDAMSSKHGSMTFAHMRRFNAHRNSIGTYGAQIVHQKVGHRLVVLDVSGSMTQETVARIVDEVVGLAYGVDAAMAIVSNNAYFWEAGAFTTHDILDKAEYRGTQYEQLAPLFDRDWETVITIADYDSSWNAASVIGARSGRIEKVIDISLVDRPTHLAECVGRLAKDVQPILVGNSAHVLSD